MQRLIAIFVTVFIALTFFATPAYAAAEPDMRSEENVIDADIGSEDTRLRVLIDYSLLNPLDEGKFIFATYGYANDRQIIQIDIRIQRYGGEFHTDVNTDLWLPF